MPSKIIKNKTRPSRFVIEVLIIIIIALLLFWFAQEYDAFEYLVEQSRLHEDWELDEFFTLLMISSIALIFIAFRNAKHLKQEISMRKEAENEIKQLAFFDSLTGLPNRDLCTNRLDHQLKHASRANELVAVLFIDLDNFKEVNDTYGHDAGDELLIQAANRLSKQLRKGDTLARFAGDEFIIVLEAIESSSKASVIAEKVLVSMQNAFRLHNHEVHVGMSIGVSIYPDDGFESSILIKHADTAMYHAKHQGKNTYRFFSNELDQQAKNKLKIASQLRQALERGEFTLFYQPIIEVATKKVKGAEALLRWKNNLLGNVPPDVFIPIAEEIGIITEIGDWVLLQACRQNKKWQQLGYINLVISVNMSARQLSSSGYVSTVEACLEKSALDAQFLELELTETTIMKEVDLAIERIEQLKALGISIALDDFGTGYSSMSYLRKLKISRIKIDSSFIQDIPANSDDVITTNAIISLANNLGLNITAEGIETEAQHKFIENTVTDAVQGYYFGRPQPAEVFESSFLQKEQGDTLG